MIVRKDRKFTRTKSDVAPSSVTSRIPVQNGMHSMVLSFQVHKNLHGVCPKCPSCCNVLTSLDKVEVAVDATGISPAPDTPGSQHIQPLDVDEPTISGAQTYSGSLLYSHGTPNSLSLNRDSPSIDGRAVGQMVLEIRQLVMEFREAITQQSATITQHSATITQQSATITNLQRQVHALSHGREQLNHPSSSNQQVITQGANQMAQQTVIDLNMQQQLEPHQQMALQVGQNDGFETWPLEEPFDASIDMEDLFPGCNVEKYTTNGRLSGDSGYHTGNA